MVNSPLIFHPESKQLLPELEVLMWRESFAPFEPWTNRKRKLQVPCGLLFAVFKCVNQKNLWICRFTNQSFAMNTLSLSRQRNHLGIDYGVKLQDVTKQAKLSPQSRSNLGVIATTNIPKFNKHRTDAKCMHRHPKDLHLCSTRMFPGWLQQRRWRRDFLAGSGRWWNWWQLSFLHQGD